MQAAWRQLHEVYMERELRAPDAPGSLQQHALTSGAPLPALADGTHMQQDAEAQMQWMQVLLH